jgi:hypothetical protein
MNEIINESLSKINYVQNGRYKDNRVTVFFNEGISKEEKYNVLQKALEVMVNFGICNHTTTHWRKNLLEIDYRPLNEIVKAYN